MKRRPNGKFLLILLMVTALTGGSVYGLHKVQVRRNAGTLLRRAERAEAEGDLVKTCEFLERYLGFTPGDTKALTKFGLILAQRGDEPDAKRGVRERALLVLEQVLGREPDRDDIRRRVARLAVDLRQFDDARNHLELLVKSAPDDGELQYLLGRSEEARGRDREAASWYEKAIEDDPHRVESYVRLTNLLRRRLNDPDRAAQTIDALVTANEKDARAYVERARDRLARETADPAGAASDAAEARALAPDDSDVLLISARTELAKPNGSPATARADLERGIERHPEIAEFYQVLADLEMRASRPEPALAVLTRGVKALPKQLDLQWALAHLLLQQGKRTEARGRIDSLREAGYPPEMLDYLGAFGSIVEEHWTEASRKLEDVVPRLVDSPELTQRSLLLLGQCYERQGNTDQQYAAYRRALTADPLSVAAHAGIASALVAMDKLNEALSEYRRITPTVPSAHVNVARLLILQTLRLPVDQRRWDEANQALDAAARVVPQSIDVPILRAQTLAAQDRIDEARRLLASARDETPDRAEIWVALAEFQATPAATLETLDQAEQRLGDRIELRLARVRHWARRGGKDASAALAKLGEDADRLSARDRGSLFLALAGAQLSLGETEKAEDLYERSAKLRPRDLGLRFLLFDLALRRDEQAAQDALNELRRVEGPQGTLWRYAQASILIQQVARRNERPPSTKNRARLSQARDELAPVATQRPSWPRVALSEAEIDDLLGNQDAAIKGYLHAIELGDRSPIALRRAVELLYARRRFDDAARVIAKIRDRSPLLGDSGLQRVMAEVALQTRDNERALELARKAVAADSKNYLDHLWLGQVLWATGRKSEAEPSLRRAIELAPTQPEPRVVLIQYLVNLDRKTDAEKEIRKAREAISKEDAPLALARCHEVVGDKAHALEMYRAAVAAAPEDTPALRGIIGFHLRSGQLRDAEPYLRTLVKKRSPDEAAWATRILTIVLASSGDPQRSREALDLVGLAPTNEDGPAPRAEEESTENLRTRARVLALQKSRRERRDAIHVLEELDRRGQATNSDRFLLAQLYEAEGDWPKARDQMLNLLSQEESNPQYLSRYAASLLRHGDAVQAQSWVAKLEQIAPQDTATVALKARLLKGTDRIKNAVSLLVHHADAHEDQIGQVAALLEELNQTGAAEAMYRRLVSKSRRPESVLVLAEFLARHGQLDDALTLCEQARKTCPLPAVANACVTVLSAGSPSVEQYRQVGDWLDAAARTAPEAKSSDLLVPLAVLRSFQGHYDDAQALYRRAIKQDNRNAVALNNLAWLLATKLGQGAEAEQLTNRAIGILGPLPALRDTRGIVYLALGRTGAAIDDLEEAAAESPTAAIYFHLAKAYRQDKQPGRVAEALQKAKELGLSRQSLDPLERADYEKDLGELAQR